jgi:predicted O-linked N-acetylglucosamine transferase (SPINDLY family)
MGLVDCVAANIEDYVERAARLATDRTWRERVRREITSASGAIYENLAAVRELEEFLIQAVREAA